MDRTVKRLIAFVTTSSFLQCPCSYYDAITLSIPGNMMLEYKLETEVNFENCYKACQIYAAEVKHPSNAVRYPMSVSLVQKWLWQLWICPLGPASVQWSMSHCNTVLRENKLKSTLQNVDTLWMTLFTFTCINTKLRRIEWVNFFVLFNFQQLEMTPAIRHVMYSWNEKSLCICYTPLSTFDFLFIICTGSVPVMNQNVRCLYGGGDTAATAPATLNHNAWAEKTQPSAELPFWATVLYR
jgi:hypothetical protein